VKIKLNEVEKQIILRHEPSVRARALLELEIVCALIRRANDCGFYLGIHALSNRVRSDNELKKELFDLDEATVEVYADEPASPQPHGWIRLVFGNNGYGLISDYSTNLETFLAPVKEVAEFWGG